MSGGPVRGGGPAPAAAGADASPRSEHPASPGDRERAPGRVSATMAAGLHSRFGVEAGEAIGRQVAALVLARLAPALR